MSAEKMRPTHEANLDLDALEREQEVIAKYPWWSGSETPRTDPRKIIALIQRLREAERVADILLDREDKATRRIAQLERVWKAAVNWREGRIGSSAALRAAILAAVEEK